MAQSKYDVNNTQVQMTMVLKLQQLRRDELPTLNYDQLEDYLMNCLWKNGCPMTLHRAANDILNTPGNRIVQYLQTRAVIDGAHQNIDEFSDLIGG